MSSKNKLTVKDHGFKKLMELGKQLDSKPFTKVGVLGRNDKRSDEEIGNVGLAVVHEFGIGVPRRAFLRGTYERKAKDWTKFMEKLVAGLVRGQYDLPKALALLGLRSANDAKATIQRSLGIEANSEATIKAKGSSRPLIDTGRLVASIDFSVVTAAGEVPGGLAGESGGPKARTKGNLNLIGKFTGRRKGDLRKLDDEFRYFSKPQSHRK